MKSILIISFCISYISAYYLPYSGIKQGITTLEKIPSRIVAGSPAIDGQFPWQASLFSMLDGNQTSGFVCGATVISEKTVVTAAHCVIQLYWFRISVGSIARWGGTQVFQFSGSAIIHAQYNPDTLNNDIALVVLPGTQKFVFDSLVKAIPIAPVNYGLLEDKVVTVSGWGRESDAGTVTTYLNHVNLRTITNAKCASYYIAGLVIDSTLCAVSNDPNSIRPGVCNGDSGGPLVSNSTGVYTLVGVVSFTSSRGCESDGPNGFARVSSHYSWIQSNKI